MTQAVAGLERVGVFLEMIKISHTVFALPFAVGSAFLAAGGMPPAAVLGKIVLAVLCARTAAMSFNRLVDRRIDGDNPRTVDRALPAGALSVLFVALAFLLALVGFFLTAAWINPLALKLSPIAALVFLGYSYTKRFTALCHLVLGGALAIAPLGAWVAVRGDLTVVPWILSSAVLLWTMGFDILYACLDEGFDRERGLHSIPVRLGVPGALRLSAVLHLLMIGALVWLGFASPHLGMIFMAVTVAVFALLTYEHVIVRPEDLSKVNRAFFTTNGIISFLLMSAMITEAVAQ